MPGDEAHRLPASLRAPFVAAVREAGALALRAFRSDQKSWFKGGGSPVSETDMAVDALLHSRLLEIAPGFGWLSEESVDDHARLTAPFVWVVDPIDGTRAYLEGRTDWVVSAALVSEGRPLMAAVYAPVDDAFYFAARGAGADLNGRPIVVTPGGDLDRARVAGPQRYQRALAAVARDLVLEPKVFSLALRLTRVAQGTLDVAFAGVNSHDWDLAAADLLVHEAGGALTTLAAQPAIYNRPEPVHGALVAAGRHRHARLIGMIREDGIRFA